MMGVEGIMDINICLRLLKYNTTKFETVTLYFLDIYLKKIIIENWIYMDLFS